MTVSADSTRRPVVVGVGELLWDLLPGERHIGGTVANFAYHANHLGAVGLVVSCLGRDAAGDEMTAQLRARGLSTDTLRYDDHHPTGTVTVTVAADGQPEYVIHTAVAWDYLRLDAPLIELALHADAVCFGTLAQRGEVSREAIQQFVRATPPDCLRVFDINLRQDFYTPLTITTSLELAHVLKLNDAELAQVLPLLDLPHDETAAIRELMSRYSLRLVALTRGKEGSTLYTDQRVSRHPGYAPEVVVDTVGAGDAFTAALVCGLVRNEDLDRIHDRASRLAGYVCSQPGATPDTRAFLASLEETPAS
jgi:fructokinase